MTKEDGEMVAKVGMVNTVLLRQLVALLEKKGLITHAEFIGQLDEFQQAVDPTIDPEMTTILRMTVDALREGAPPGAVN